MARLTLTIDSASASEMWNFVCAFQRTAGIPLPRQIPTEPTVTIAGSCFGITTPAMTQERAEAMLREYVNLQNGGM